MGAKGTKEQPRSEFSMELIEQVAARLENGEPLTDICRDPAMPSRRAVQLWCKRHEDVELRIGGARELQAEAIVWRAFKGLENASTSVEVAKYNHLVYHAMKLASKLDPAHWRDTSQQDVNMTGELSVKRVILHAADEN